MLQGDGPSSTAQLHAYVYGVAEKYDCPALRDYALEGFRYEVELSSYFDLKGAVFAAYQQVQLPESNRVLKDTVLEAWVSHRKTVKFVEEELRQLLKDVPEFAEDLAVEHLRPPSLPSPTRARFTSPLTPTLRTGL